MPVPTHHGEPARDHRQLPERQQHLRPGRPRRRPARPVRAPSAAARSRAPTAWPPVRRRRCSTPRPSRATRSTGTVFSNTATVTDGKTPTTNNSSTASTTVAGRADPEPQEDGVEPGQRGRPVHGRHRERRDDRASRRPPAASATTAQTGATTLTAGTTYTLTDAMAGGSVSDDRPVHEEHRCTNTNVGSTHRPAERRGRVVLDHAGQQRRDHLHVHQRPDGADAPALEVDQLALRGERPVHRPDQERRRPPTASATTSGAGTTASTATTAVTAGTTYTLTEVMAGGTERARPTTRARSPAPTRPAGTGTTLPTGAGQSFTITPAAGDAISCTLTNAAKPHVTLVKTVGEPRRGRRPVHRRDHPRPVRRPTRSATTSGVGTSATTGSQGLVAGTTYTLTDAMAGGLAVGALRLPQLHRLHQRDRRLGHHAAQRLRHVVHR